MAEDLPIEGAPPRYTITLPETASPDEVAAANARANQSEVPTPSEPAASEPGEPSPAAEEPPAPNRRNLRAEKRIHGLNAQLKDAQARIADLENRLNTQTTPEPAPQRPARPEIDDYDSTDDYVTALTQWQQGENETRAREIYAEERQRERDDAEAAQRAQAQQTREERIGTSIEHARLNHEDFDDVIATAPTLSQAGQALLWESDDPGAVMYYLATHPAEVERINGLSPARITAAYVAIEDQLQANSTDAPASPPANEPPAPEVPVRQSSPEPIRGSTETTATSGNPFLQTGSVDVMAMNNWVENQRKSRGVG